MKEETKLVYCKYRMVNVDLQKGFHGCIQENQCFCDDPCPLDGMFDQPSGETRSETASKLPPTE